MASQRNPEESRSQTSPSSRRRSPETLIAKTGELIPDLLDLVDRGLIRIMDVIIVLTADDGSFETLTPDDLDPAKVGDLGSLAGAASGLFSQRTRQTSLRSCTQRSSTHPHVREPVVVAIRQRSAACRRSVDLGRSHSHPGSGRCAGQSRSLNKEKH